MQMTLKEYKDFCWAAKHAIIDLVMLECYTVHDKVGVSEFIEDMKSRDLYNLTTTMFMLDETTNSWLLTNLYNDYLQSKNSDILVTRESQWAEKRNMTLLSEANPSDDDDATKLAGDISDAVMKGSLVMAVGLIARKAVDPKNRKVIKDALGILRRDKGKIYNRIAKQPIVKQFAPGARMSTKTGQKIFTKDPAANLSNKLKRAGDRAITLAKDLDKKITKVRNMKTKDLMKMNLKYVIPIAGMAGATALAYAIYQRMYSSAAKSCEKMKGREKSKCMMRFKINAANQAIDKLQEMIIGCENKKDPDKCKYSIQRQIWNWTRRKQKYQEKLAKLDQTRHPKKTIFKTKRSYA